ncbi:hypothetical protein HETIRDRAFT_125359 [Heterobasidion irregulare TC 32-1]|uniref:DUF431-domain-containing protein n=1 Tax=Heterobasidion irregulare (strain TC 32-1) TaxID=747525 RepID=W4JVN1_HETIT|nr:uncharacterized protein HETIRDRAFT_125359 [Heterobasidion irregulare TC 32-1]ETW77597.1 hypothetical protein HETIRDRAFT_125359 [Heterobasidion irregulare TC 32-1]
MEEDDETPRALPRWVELEYNHMRTLAGPGAQVRFTNLSRAAATSLAQSFAGAPAPAPTDRPALGLAESACETVGVLELMQRAGVPRERVCLLDPKAEKALAPSDGEGEGAFEWFLFGVRDDPPRDRTGELRAMGFPGRHLGSVQMTTDTALGVTKRVVVDKVPLEEIPYVDHPTIVFSPHESVEMPFRYIQENDAPLLPPGMKAHLREDLDRSFEF